MPEFNGKSLGGDLRYDFSDFGHPDIKGVVPEPSRFAVKKFLRDVQAAFKSLKLAADDAPEQASPDDIVNTMNKIDDEELFDKLTESITDALAELCGGSPTRDQLERLGYRPFMGFFGYLMENLMNPELSRPGIRNSQVALRSV
jgi:hypothetical protein